MKEEFAGLKVYNNGVVKMEYDGSIVFSEFLQENTIINLDVAREIVDSRVALTDGRKHLLCLKTNKFSYASKEVRDFMQSAHGKKNILAGAFVTPNTVSSIFFNFFIKINGVDRDVPTKCFSNETDAVAWLEKYKKSQ